MRISFVRACSLAGIFLFAAINSHAATLGINQLKCDYSINPMGVDSVRPRLFWMIEGGARGQRQTAYEVLVASSEKILANNEGDLWASGKVASDETIQISYGGKELRTAQQVFWKVRVWDVAGKVSAWSRPATWTMGVLNDSDWQASWIAAPTNEPTLLLRREFVVKPGLKRALVNVCGLGQYEMSLNGKKVGVDLLAPGWTKYDKTCLYDTQDLTAVLKKGRNAVGLLLGNGMYNVKGGGRYAKFENSFGPLKAIAQLRLEYADGSVEIIGTDASWRVAPGPITFSSVYGGEDFDARLVQAGWDKPNFDDARWQAAQVVSGPGGTLRGLSCAAPPIRAFEVLKPVAIKQLGNGIAVYDFGQNASLMAQFTVRGAVGASLRLIPAELVNSKGFTDRRSVAAQRDDAYWKYTLAGTGDENYFSKFFYHGSRYFQVELLPAPGQTNLPVIKSLAGVVVHSASEPVGEFECSNLLFNRIHKLIRWAQRSNMMSLMTDCPHRERLGWLEEDHLNGPSLRYEFNLAQLFTKTMNDMADSQLPIGLVPTTAPEYTVFGNEHDVNGRNLFGDSPEWGSAFILVPWQQYEFDGDVELLRHHYGQMTNYVHFLGGRASHNIVSYGLGDWYDIGPRPPGVSQLTPLSLTATAFYFQDAQIMANVAALLGKTDDAKQFQALADEIRSAFNKKFYDASNRIYGTGSQTANSIPLVMNLCAPTNRAAVLDAIVRDVRARGLTAGDVGYRYLLRALADGGRSDVVFEMNNQSEKPGYGYQLKMGATSLTEAWNAGRSSSQNHFMLGQIMEWFYHDLVGIQSGGDGFKTIVIAPQPVGDVTWAKASYNSLRGKISCGWQRSGDQFTLQVTIPSNTTATVRLPAKSAAGVLESGRPAIQSSGVKFLRAEDDRAVYEIQSGTYTFASKF